MSNIALMSMDGTPFPNLALMKISRYHKQKGDNVEWYDIFNFYERLYISKCFTFKPDYGQIITNAKEVIRGGTGYDISVKLPPHIEKIKVPDYSIYPNCNFSIQFYSRGCIRNCNFCCVRQKEGYIHPVEPIELNPNGEWIEVLDNNFFANPEWRTAIIHLQKCNQPVKFHGVDIRIMDEEQAYWLNKIRIKNNIHIAWDLPQIDLTEKLKSVIKYLPAYKLTCYVLVGFNSTIEQDLYRLNTLKALGITPFVQPYRDFENKRQPTQYEKDVARWANKRWLFKSCDFKDFEPRKGFRCEEYLKQYLEDYEQVNERDVHIEHRPMGNALGFFQQT